jgi:hypothetical protein
MARLMARFMAARSERRLTAPAAGKGGPLPGEAAVDDARIRSCSVRSADRTPPTAAAANFCRPATTFR